MGHFCRYSFFLDIEHLMSTRNKTLQRKSVKLAKKNLQYIKKNILMMVDYFVRKNGASNGNTSLGESCP